MSARLAALLLASFVPPGHKLPACLRPEVPAVEVATLTDAEAKKINGHRAVFVVELDSDSAERGGFVVFDCRSPGDSLGTVWLRPGQEEQARMNVKATLRRVWHKPSLGFAGFVEYRLLDAVIVE